MNLALAAVLALSLGPVGHNKVEKAQQNFFWWWSNQDNPSWVAAFNSPGCIPSGTVLSPGPTTLTVTRASVQYVDIGGTLTSCPADTLAVSAQGAEVWAQGVNAARQSSTSCVANAVQTPWTRNVLNETCTSDVTVAPDGTTSMDEWVTVTNTGAVFAGATTASSTTFTASAWLSKPSGTGTAMVWVGLGSAVSGCACGTSDGSACTAAVLLTNYCAGKFTAVGTTPARGWITGTGTATTTPTIWLIPGEYGVSAGTTRFWGAQIEVGSYPTPYIPTTTGTGTRNATVASVPLPDFSATDTACFGVTYTPGQNWNTTGTRTLLSNDQGAGANKIVLYKSGSDISLLVNDNASGSKNWDYAHGLAAVRTTKRIVACMAAGTLSMYLDGAPIGAGSGAGTALQSATLTPLQIGAQNSGTFLDGAVSNVKVYPGKTYRAGM